jgi:outer membrane protein OmpA-like peptidoglycan-associated protein
VRPVALPTIPRISATIFLKTAEVGFDKAVVRPGEREKLIAFAKKYLRGKTCQITIFAHTDHTGSQRHDLWLSWLRGAAVKQVLVENGVDNRLVTVVARGYEDPSIDAISGLPTATNRRAQTYATCRPT